MKDLKKQITDSLIGKTFLYQSKYGGYVEGEIESAFFSQVFTGKEHKTHKTVKGNITLPIGDLYFRYELNIRSTKGIVYEYDEIFIKSKNNPFGEGNKNYPFVNLNKN